MRNRAAGGRRARRHARLRARRGGDARRAGGPLATGAERAGRAIEAALLRAVRTGKLGFDDLKRSALSALAEIAAAAVRGGIGAIAGRAAAVGGRRAGGVLARRSAGCRGGRPAGRWRRGAAYLVGERGPELFVPTASGRIETGVGGGAREVRVAITVNARAGEAPAALRGRAGRWRGRCGRRWRSRRSSRFGEARDERGDTRTAGLIARARREWAPRSAVIGGRRSRHGGARDGALRPSHGQLCGSSGHLPRAGRD